MDDLIGEFINETSESLGALERALAEHTREPMTRQGWDMAYRLMHTIKGTCGFLRLASMEAVADTSERLLAGLRDGKIAPTDAELSALRAAMAQISFMMDHLALHGSEPTAPVAEPKPEPVDVQEAPAPDPAPKRTLGQLNEQVHRTSDNFTLPPLSEAPTRTALATRNASETPAPTGEAVNAATLASLISVRNQLKHIAATGSDGRVNNAQRTLDSVIVGLKEKVLARVGGEQSFPRVAKVLMVESAGMRFAFAQGAIREVARIGDAYRQAKLVEGAMLSLRGEWLPRVSLSGRLGQSGAGKEAFALVMEIDGERMAICVEYVGELEELALQKLPRLLRSSKIYEAAAILGDGSPCLILDAHALLVQEQQAVAETAVPAPVAETTAAPEPVKAVEPEPVTTTPFLLFSDGTAVPKAIPLMHIIRVEHILAADVKPHGKELHVQCRGETLQVRALPGSVIPQQGDFPLIMLLDDPTTGIAAHRVGGIVDAAVTLPSAPANQTVLLRTRLDDAMTEIINARAFLPRERNEVAHA